MTLARDSVRRDLIGMQSQLESPVQSTRGSRSMIVAGANVIISVRAHGAAHEL
jgi:hypothetical protein